MGDACRWWWILSVGLAVSVSTPLGLIAGFFGGLADNVIMRVMDLILPFPADSGYFSSESAWVEH